VQHVLTATQAEAEAIHPAHHQKPVQLLPTAIQVAAAQALQTTIAAEADQAPTAIQAEADPIHQAIIAAEAVQAQAVTQDAAVQAVLRAATIHQTAAAHTQDVQVHQAAAIPAEVQAVLPAQATVAEAVQAHQAVLQADAQVHQVTQADTDRITKK
jgi:hypothetical protein